MIEGVAPASRRLLRFTVIAGNQKCYEQSHQVVENTGKAFLGGTIESRQID